MKPFLKIKVKHITTATTIILQPPFPIVSLIAGSLPVFKKEIKQGCFVISLISLHSLYPSSPSAPPPLFLPPSHITPGSLRLVNVSFQIRRLKETDMALSALTKSLDVSDRRSVNLFISDIRFGQEAGKVHQVWQYCPETYRSDGYIPPNLNYTDCFLHSNTVAIYPAHNQPSLKSLILKTKVEKKGFEEDVAGVLMAQEGLLHAIHGHTVKGGGKVALHIARKQPHFNAFGLKANSTLISGTMMCGLVKYTLAHPDKLSILRNGNLAYEKAYKTEIGHSISGCCHVMRVIVNPVSFGQRRSVVTAYPVTCFLSQK